MSARVAKVRRRERIEEVVRAAEEALGDFSEWGETWQMHACDLYCDLSAAGRLRRALFLAGRWDEDAPSCPLYDADGCRLPEEREADAG